MLSPHIIEMLLFATSTGSCPSPHIIEIATSTGSCPSDCSLRLLVFLSVTTHYRNVVLFATSTGSCPSPHIIEMLYCSLRLLVLVRHHTL